MLLYATGDSRMEWRGDGGTQVLKLGTCLYNFIWENDLSGAIRRAAAHGLSALEVMATAPQLDARSFDGRRRDELLQVMEETDTKIVSINPTFIDLNLASRNDTFRRESVVEVKACIDVASALGAELVVVGPGRRHPLVMDPLEMSDRLAHPAIRECVDYAASKGVIYGFENITSLYMVRSEEIAAFIDAVDNPYCRAVFDTANARYAEDPAEAIRVLGERICHVHLSDSNGTVPAHWPIGRGDIDFRGVANALREIGYTGWSFLETTWMDDPDGAISGSLAALRQYGWEPAATQRPGVGGVA
jgi:sugar phosphate isomerase/epimerase